MPNPFGIESEMSQALPDAGFWDELPLQIGGWNPAGTGAAIVADNDATSPAIGGTINGARVLQLTADGTYATPGVAGFAFETALPQLLTGRGSDLQNINPAVAGPGGPFIELLVLARANVNVATAIAANVTTADIPSSICAYRLSNLVSASVPFVIGTTLQGYSWISMVLARPDIPATQIPMSQLQRDRLSSEYRNNNVPTPISIRLVNGVCAGTAIISIKAAVIRYRRHIADRFIGRQGFSGGGQPSRVYTAPATGGGSIF